MATNIQKLRQVNNQPLMIIEENGNKLVPIRPICDALGIDSKSQRDKINEDEFLSSTGVLNTSVAGDGKDREMFCIPYKYVFGWLFTINPKNVNPEAKEYVMKFRNECYEVLYNHFTDKSEFLEQKQTQIEKKLQELSDLEENYKSAKNLFAACKQELNEIKNLSFNQWQEENQQLSLNL